MSQEDANLEDLRNQEQTVTEDMNETKNEEIGAALDEFDMAPLLKSDKVDEGDAMKTQQRLIATGLKVEACNDQIQTGTNKQDDAPMGSGKPGDANPEVLRLIQQYLRENGMQKIAHDIETETGVEMENNAVIKFRQNILNGQFVELFSRDIAPSEQGSRKMISKKSTFDIVTEGLSPQKQQLMMYYIYEQNYIELMESGKSLEAIQLLQKQLVPRSPFGKDKSNLFKLASMVMRRPLAAILDCNKTGSKRQKGSDEPALEGIESKQKMEFENGNGVHTDGIQSSLVLKSAAAQEQDATSFDYEVRMRRMREQLLQKLHVYLPKNSMLMPNRLETLLTQSIDWQINQCQYHNVDENQGKFSLLKDHECPKSMLPTTCMVTLRRHKEQVWFCKFNPRGDKFATVCKDGLILIWSIIKVSQENVYEQQPAKRGSPNLFMGLPSHVSPMHPQTTYRLQLTHEIKEYQKLVACVNWAPNGNWICSCSNKDFTARVWDVTHPAEVKQQSRSQPRILLENQMVCMLRKHQNKIIKIEFYSDTVLVSCSHDKTIIFWELIKQVNQRGDYSYKAKDFLKVTVPTFYLDIAITQNRFICRKGKPDGKIKIIKFRNIKDLRAEMFSDDFQKQVSKNHSKRKDSETMQPVVQHIDKQDDVTIMEMITSACGKYLLLCVQKPWLELYDLTKVPQPKCVRRFFGYVQTDQILLPGFAGINQSFVVCGSEGTGEDAAIYIWKRDTGELLSKLPGSGQHGHTNIISQVDGSRGEPYLFISCSDDETVKLWAVKDRIKIDVVFQSVSGGSKDGVKKINVKNESQEKKDRNSNEEQKEEPSRRRSRAAASDSGWGEDDSSQHRSQWASSDDAGRARSQDDEDSDEDIDVDDEDSELSSSNQDEDEEDDDSEQEDQGYNSMEEESKEAGPAANPSEGQAPSSSAQNEGGSPSLQPSSQAGVSPTLIRNEDIEMTEEIDNQSQLLPVIQHGESSEDDRNSVTYEQQQERQNEWNMQWQEAQLAHDHHMQPDSQDDADNVWQ